MNLFLKLAYLFFIGSVLGWVLELFYRRFISGANPERKWINPGFCVGPYVPLYGSGLCILYLLASFGDAHGTGTAGGKVLLIAGMALSMTAIEYIAGLMSLKLMHIRLWDYSSQWGNIQGLICPQFSLIWAAASAGYYFLVHPHILDALKWLSENLAFSFVIGYFFGVFTIDVVYSAHLLTRIRQFAKENEVDIKVERLKSLIRSRQDERREKANFLFAFRSSHSLAEHLRVSIATVSGAYEQLVDEGYLAAKPRSGYYVSAISRLPSGSAAQPRLRMLPADDAPAQEASGYGFRYSALTKLMREVIADCGTRLLEKPPHYGCAELRNAIAEYLLRYRGMLAQPECIVIGSGAEYLYGLVVQLLGRDRVYGLEDPGYEKVRQVYAANGAVCELLPMSDDGIRADALQRTDATVLHVTPFHSFPTGITTSAAKRSEYLAWAAGRDAILIEDDFDSEFSENKKPLQTLYSMDRRGCVIYINTFSHSLAPSMRMGYMVLPEALMARYREQLGFYSCSVPLFDQYVLARFISQGYFERHLNRLRRQNKGKPE